MDNNSAISKYIRKAKRIYHGDRKTKQRFIDDICRLNNFLWLT